MTNITIVTQDCIEGFKIENTYGLVQGNSVRSANFLKDFSASFSTIFGGEVKGYTQVVQAARSKAIERMVKEAKKQGLDSD